MSFKGVLGRRFLVTTLSVVLGSAAVAGGTALAAPSTGISLAAASSPAATPGAAATGTVGSHLRKAIRRRLVRVFVQTTAKDTGLSVKQVRQDLRSGQSLNDIAGNKASQVEQQTISTIRDFLKKEVDAGKITQKQENALMDKLQSVADRIMAAHRTPQSSPSIHGAAASVVTPTTV